MRGSPVRNLAAVLTLAVIILLSGCGGGGVGVTTPPMGNFTNGNLKGNYAFSYQGSDVNGFPFVAAGQFAANGSGMITGGAMDLNDSIDGLLIAPGAIQGTSTYSVSADGETSVTLNVLTAGGVQTLGLQMTLSSSTHGLVIAFDNSFSGSGTIDMQAANAAIPTPANFAFALSGVDNQTIQEAMFGGNILVSGANTITTGSSVADIVSPGLGILDTDDSAFSGTVTPDPVNPGRSVLQLTTAVGVFGFAAYAVDATQVKIAEIDVVSGFLVGGDAFAAPGTPNQQLAKGNFAYTVSGEAHNGASFAAGGVFTSNGTGAITGGIQDLHSSQVFSGQNLANEAYASDPNFARVVITLNDGTAPFAYAAYPTSEGRVMLVEIDGATNGDCECFASGIAYQQSSTTAPSGPFALNITGLAITKHSIVTQDVVGQIKISGTTVTGNLNINNVQATNKLLTGAGLTNSTTSAPDSTFGRGTGMTLTSGNVAFGLDYYTVDGSRVLLLEVDGTRVSTGQLLAQTN